MGQRSDRDPPLEVVAHLAWPGAAWVARIERSRRFRDKEGTEVAHVVTSLPAAERPG